MWRGRPRPRLSTIHEFDGTGTNPNNFYVFGFTDADLGGSIYTPQQFTH